MHDLKTPTVVRHNSADAFLHECATWLSRNEDLNHGLLSLADALRSTRHIHRPPFIFCHVESDEEILGCAIFAEPDPDTSAADLSGPDSFQESQLAAWRGGVPSLRPECGRMQIN